jgi:hypothetical protein
MRRRPGQALLHRDASSTFPGILSFRGTGIVWSTSPTKAHFKQPAQNKQLAQQHYDAVRPLPDERVHK